MGTFIRFFLLLCAVGASLAADCKNAQNCSSCIQTPNCRWCGKPGEFSSDTHSLLRCSNRAGGSLDEWSMTCGQENIYSPENFFKIVADEELSKAGVLAGGAAGGAYSGSSGSYHGSSQQSIVQLKPQGLSLKLRVEESQSISVRFRQAEDYPVDLYYLMDLSNSMADDKDSLSALGATLAYEMQKITQNFRLGFGSFVDKVVMPYVSTVPSKLEAPCTGCAPPYGFRNALPLNSDSQKFVHEVNEAPVSGNLDAPEGGFDAIMQAIMCKREIGWREQARHLLLFSTDAGFHYAGDGKLGGIVKPNDGQCHLDSEGKMYTHSTLQDYPSVAQINRVAKQENINIIFAVTSEQTSVYTRLSKMIEGSSTGQLTANSSNIVELVKSEYRKITRKLIMKDNATAPVRIRYFSTCKGGPEVETNICDNLHVGDEVSFRVEMSLDSCPADRSLWHQRIEISPVALKDALILDLEMLCDCECERPGHPGYVPNSDHCQGQGTYSCGVCRCHDGFIGKKCECGTSDITSSTTTVIDESSCIAENDTKVCSGQGTCNCGVCQCNTRDNEEEIINGEFCECTNFLCGRQFGELCSGPEHGRCECSKCKCEPGWTGEDCECRNSTESCVAPGGTTHCSGHGECQCNACICHETEEGWYSGKFCEDCPACKGKCEEYQACVQCQIFETGPLTPEECALNCTRFNATKVDEATEDAEGERSCAFFDENDCRFAFVYGYDENNEPVVKVQRTLECPPKLDILGIVLGVIGAIVAVGLALLLMWKVLTTIHDRREYARFSKESGMAKFDAGENPIFIQATTTIMNPTYTGKK